MAHLRGAMAGLAALAVLASACGSGGSQFVTNDDERLYLELPADWTTFDNAQIMAEIGRLPAMSTLDQVRYQERRWMAGFATTPEVSVVGLLEPMGSVPTGYVQVLRLDEDQHSSISVSDLRALGWPPTEDGTPLDPLEFARENPDGQIRVTAYDEPVIAGRGRGVHTRAMFDGVGDADTIMRDVTAYVDDASLTVYVLVVGCLARCFASNAAEIDAIVESWTLEELP
ncbi:MAG: hypothetical protein AB7L84_01000 [Acidimicrobiia bacterium]